MQLTEIEHRIYDVESAQRQRVCLSLHATLLGRSSIPRVWIPTDRPLYRAPSNVLQFIFQQCLLISIPEVLSQSVSDALKFQGIIRQLTSADRDILRSFIEEFMCAESGIGCVYYETARFTPEIDQDLYALLVEGAKSYLYWRSDLIHILKKRSESAAEAVKQINFITTSYRHAPIFCQKYCTQIKTVWCDLWQSHSVYNIETPEERSIVSLPLIDSL